MRKLLILAAALVSTAVITVETAEARPYGRGWGARPYVAYGPRYRAYGYRPGIGAGAAVGLGVAGLAAGAIAAGAAHDAYYRDRCYYDPRYCGY